MGRIHVGQYGKAAIIIAALTAAAVIWWQTTRPVLIDVELLIRNGTVYDGTLAEPVTGLVIGINEGRIAAIEPAATTRLVGKQLIDATGLVVAPGFIDPHTHSLRDLRHEKRRANLNYLYQGVTTVVNGNDGAGATDIAEQLQQLTAAGIGTNVALFVGHGTVREQVLGRANRAATEAEMTAMKALVAQAMSDGALGLSSGLHYVPGSYASTEELVQLAAVAAAYNGIYESHIRDESSYSIGVVNAIDEAISIGRKAGLPVHIAHIKALGVDVWGKSDEIIQRIAAARQAGLTVTADQYPWRASGTGLRSAVVSQAMRANGPAAFYKRLQNPQLLPAIKAEVTENIRRRGGPDTLMIINSYDNSLLTRTLAEIARDWKLSPTEAAIRIMAKGYSRVASFNMHPDDIENFMVQPWVLSSSDGNDGHPRKYASYPKKYHDYVVNKPLLSLSEFIHRSSGLVADTLQLPGRGYLKPGYQADLVLFNPETFRPVATFQQWNRLAEGVAYVLVNGEAAIAAGEFTGKLNGLGLRRGDVATAAH